MTKLDWNLICAFYTGIYVGKFT